MKSSEVKYYKVAGHVFSLEAEADSFLWSNMRHAYSPFEIDGSCTRKPLFSIVIRDHVTLDQAVRIFSDADSSQAGYFSTEVRKSDDGSMLFLISQPSSQEVNARLCVSADYSCAELSLHGSELMRYLSFTNAVNICYLLATARLDTLLTHSSAVMYKGKAYIFLGKSGTGKSTHSRMWLSALEGVELMNDDHPVIRIEDDGSVVLYGSPWSGKTSCYKNISAPLGGVVRIGRAPHNKAVRLSPIHAYASLMTSCSGLTWEKHLADGKDRTLQAVVSKVPCWLMECLPDEDAARVCSSAVSGIWEDEG